MTMYMAANFQFYWKTDSKASLDIIYHPFSDPFDKYLSSASESNSVIDFRYNNKNVHIQSLPLGEVVSSEEGWL